MVPPKIASFRNPGELLEEAGEEEMLTEHKVNRHNPDYKRVRELLDSSFPQNERVPFLQLMLFSLRKGTSFLSFRDDGEFVGTAYIVEYEDNLSLFYLAVSPGKRGHGYGSKILNAVKAKQKSLNLNLDVEAPEKGAPNLPQRLSRVEFYRKNGIVDTGYRLYDNGVKCMILSSDPESFNPASFTRMWRSYLFGLLKEKLFKE